MAQPASPLYDIAIVGGGINGCGIARDAAGRGLSVYLCEQGDLAGATSSTSTKLIHGGLRYLEHYEFRLVRESLSERERLWAIAPHIVWPLRFVLPHHRDMRPAWLLRLGLFLYDNIGGRKRLPATRTLDLSRDEAGRPLKPGLFKRGFEYSDCWVDDARLVVLNARDAAARGATIRTRTRAIGAERTRDEWRLLTQDVEAGARDAVRARILVNAAGPWADRVLGTTLGIDGGATIRLVQGSHIVVPRLYDHDRPYIFQNADDRIVFAIPYADRFTLIGTTDRDYEGDPGDAEASAAEVDYLCRSAGEYFAKPIGPADVVWTYSGVRPLYDEGGGAAQRLTRDYVLALDAPDEAAPALTVYGGKITTYRRLAEEALAKLAPHLPQAKGEQAGWTGRAPLPGGDFPTDGVDALIADIARGAPWLDRAGARRLVLLYGTEARRILGGATSAADLGRSFGGGLTEAELDHLMRREWARTAQDVAWRRTKLGLVLSPPQIEVLDLFMRERRERESFLAVAS